MRFPKLQKLRTVADVQTRFGGYRHTDNVPEGDFYDCENLSPEAFPLLRVRPPRAAWYAARTDEHGETVSLESTRMFLGEGVTAAANVSDKLVLCTSGGIFYNGGYVAGAPELEAGARRTIVPFGRNFFIVPDGIYVTVSDDGAATATAVECPRMDYAAEHDNRVWGCRFGEDAGGTFVNELYACALGDPTAWETFDGISTDSYRVNLGCGGAFTGVCPLGGDVLFFKEDHIIRVSGETPSDFTVLTFPADGAEEGAFRSVVNVNGRVFYKSRAGITAFDGVTARCVSEALGERRFTEVCAGTVDGRYYFAGTDPAGARKIFCYDPETGLWHKEDDGRNTRFFVYRRHCLYLVCHEARAGTEFLPVNLYRFFVHDARRAPDAVTIFRNESEPDHTYRYLPEEPVKWYAETGRLSAGGPQALLLRRLHIALRPEEGAKLRVQVKCDGEEDWRTVYECDSAAPGAFTLPVRLPRCAFYRLRLSGEGGCVIDSVTRIYEKAGEPAPDGLKGGMIG